MPNPLEIPGRLAVNPTHFPGPLVAPHLVASQNGQNLQLISLGGETKLEKLAGRLVEIQLEHLLARGIPPQNPPDHLEPPLDYPPNTLPRLTDEQVATMTENAIHLAGATLEMVFHTQRAKPAKQDQEEGADNAEQ